MLRVSLLFSVNILSIVNVLRSGVMGVALYVDTLRNEMRPIKLENRIVANHVEQLKICGFGNINPVSELC